MIKVLKYKIFWKYLWKLYILLYLELHPQLGGEGVESLGAGGEGLPGHQEAPGHLGSEQGQWVGIYCIQFHISIDIVWSMYTAYRKCGQWLEIDVGGT